MEILLIIALIICTFFSAYASASETSLFSLSPLKIKSYRSHPDKIKQLIATLISRPRELLVTILILNVLANILIQNLASHIFHNSPGWGLKVGLPLIITLLLGEILPKSVALPNNERIAYRVAPVIGWITRLLGPLRTFISRTASHVSHLIFYFLKTEEPISLEELQHALKASEKHGVLTPDEAEFIDGYLSLQDSSVKELLRPREEVLFYEVESPLTKLVYLFVDLECSRVPVCDRGIDNVRGIISAHQFFLHRNEITAPADLAKFFNKPFFVPETTPAKILLRQFRQRDESMAVVVDEYGSVSGLVTKEDLIEAVVGEISDRRDGKSHYTRSGQNVIIASGKLELEEFEEIFGVALKSPNNRVTIGGWLTEQMGEIPKSGAKYIKEGFLFQILAAAPNRIRRIYIRKLKTETQRR